MKSFVWFATLLVALGLSLHVAQASKVHPHRDVKTHHDDDDDAPLADRFSKLEALHGLDAKQLKFLRLAVQSFEKNIDRSGLTADQKGAIKRRTLEHFVGRLNPERNASKANHSKVVPVCQSSHPAPDQVRLVCGLLVLVVAHGCQAMADNGTTVDKVGPLPTTAPSPPASHAWQRPRIQYDRDLVIELVEAADYPIETHVLTTRDGYILKLHRIPDPRQFPEEYENGPPDRQQADGVLDEPNLLRFGPRKPQFRGVVLLVPGLFSTAADFVITGPENGLAFVLADAGYDVWMANVRGSRFARKNVHLTVVQSDFWDFSFHEIGTIDIAAIIDYILLETNEQRLYYVGHNQGMTALFVLLSAKPRYNRKIHHAAGLASIAYLGTTDSQILRRAADLTDRVYATLRSLNVHEIKPSIDIVHLLSGTICSGDTREMCAEMLRGVLGSTVDRSRNMLPHIVDDLWCSISTRQLIHFGQLMQTKKFQQFDYRNYMLNTKQYGQAKPPEYNLSRVLLPVSLFHGAKDFITSTQDALRLRNELPNVKYFVEVPNMNHIDFVYSDLLYGQVTSKIIEIFKQT
ncbi:lipase 3-like [Anopheles bellator]|uniref:lipase 3-like n=1 Tax=Anopheles bellator TaxID=139047 RepID=UPI0026482DC1|nr:lipase 3-like [Anopheles bellator]